MGKDLGFLRNFLKNIRKSKPKKLCLKLHALILTHLSTKESVPGMSVILKFLF